MFSITKKEVLPTQELHAEDLNDEELSQIIGGNSDHWGWHHHFHHFHHHEHGHWDWEKLWKPEWVKEWKPVWAKVWESGCD